MAKATGKKYQPSPKVLACRENGRKGGLARAANNSKAKLVKIATKGGQKLHELHGDDYYSHIVGLRRFVGRYRRPTAKQLAAEALVKKTRKKAA
jgi:general stress protein YciG